MISDIFFDKSLDKSNLKIYEDSFLAFYVSSLINNSNDCTIDYIVEHLETFYGSHSFSYGKVKKYIEKNDKDGKVKEVFEKCTTTKNGKLALEDGIAFWDLRDWSFVQYPETKDRKALEAKENVISINETLKSKVRIAG